jgi:DNA-binding NarL/FixJ family response regulator
MGDVVPLVARPSTTDSQGAGLPIAVVLADDHQAARRHLRRSLAIENDVEVLADSEDLSTAPTLANGHLPDVVVLDLRMANGWSLELIRRLRTQAPASAIVVLTTEDSPTFAERALDAGAAAYVLTHHGHTGLAAAIRRAARGEKYVSPLVAARLDALRRAATNDGLSQRETEVLRSVALGFTSDEIAAELHLSKRTIDTHRIRIHRKLRLATRAELVRYALAHHLIGA